jgi:hypothetical protein
MRSRSNARFRDTIFKLRKGLNENMALIIKCRSCHRRVAEEAISITNMLRWYIQQVQSVILNSDEYPPLNR